MILLWQAESAHSHVALLPCYWCRVVVDSGFPAVLQQQQCSGASGLTPKGAYRAMPFPRYPATIPLPARHCHCSLLQFSACQ